MGESRPARSPSGRKNDGKKELPAAKLNDSISEAETEDYTNYNDTNNNDTLNDTHDNTHNNTLANTLVCQLRIGATLVFMCLSTTKPSVTFKYS